MKKPSFKTLDESIAKETPAVQARIKRNGERMATALAKLGTSASNSGCLERMDCRLIHAALLLFVLWFAANKYQAAS
ncbi:MAG: hypothetical protein HY847_10135 [Betaproteobacteria bacterium]|nr:hypothetical protein [Betaproteobacteria bacterium]